MTYSVYDLCVTDCDSVFWQNRYIEGGMGIHFYRNAATGGDWIIQKGQSVSQSVSRSVSQLVSQSVS